MNDLSWSPEETFESGLYRTVKWYLDNKTWWQKILDNNDNQLYVIVRYKSDPTPITSITLGYS